MTAEEIKVITDKINQEEIDHAESDLKQVQIEILENAKNGLYNLSYSFLPDTNFSRVNAISNHLLALGFEVEIGGGENMGNTCLVLLIDWSKNQN